LLNKDYFDKIASGFKEKIWDKNHRLQAATVIVRVAQEIDPAFNSYEFFEACGLVDRAA